MRINSATIQNWILPVAALVAWEIFGRAGMLPRYLSFPTRSSRRCGSSPSAASSSLRWRPVSIGYRPDLCSAPWPA